jgi:hypothetical protein
MAFSFLKGKKLVVPTKTPSGRGDPVALAKEGIIKAATQQKALVGHTQRKEKLPQSKGGRAVSTWFNYQHDGWVTTIRYGQLSIPLDDKGTTGVLVGPNIEDLTSFYDAVIESIRKGELDTVIGDLQKKRSASLKGKTGGGRKNPT